jgi:galactose-1-phosphate uridylyltransferase
VRNLAQYVSILIFIFTWSFVRFSAALTKLKYLAGVESGLGTFLNDTEAEERAAALRAAEPSL